MLSFDATQASLALLGVKTVKWVFLVYDKNDVGYSFPSGESGLTPIVINDFSGINLQRNLAENTVIAPSEISFNISNEGNTLTFSDFKGGYVIVRLYIYNTTTSAYVKMAGWKFRIKTASPSYQNLAITAEDFLQHYLTGYYPNTRYPQDIFASDRIYENESLCVPVPFGTAYVPLRDVYITDAGYILLGDPTYNYTITKVRSPRNLGSKCEWDSGTSSFTQATKTDINAVDWRVFQAIIADTDNDGTADAPGFWLIIGGPVLDPLVQFTRSDTASMTDFADVIEFVLKDMGVPSANIDSAVSFAAAKAVFAGWGLECNGAFWYKQEREKVLALLLTMCHSCLSIGETIELHVLSKTSKKTITDEDVLRSSEKGEGSFGYEDVINEDLSDGGYVAWQASGEGQDEFLKTLTAVGAVATVICDEVLECPFVQDSENIQKIGTLHFQRRLLKEGSVSFLAKGTCLALQPDDVITINESNYGGNYAVLIDSVQINKDLSIQFQCSKFSSAFDDWEDLSPVALVVPTDDTPMPWQPVISGPDSDTSGSGKNPNILPGRLRIGETGDHIILDPESPMRIALYDNDVEILRLGNLNGFLGYVAEIYGIAIGEATKYLKYDPTNGLQIAGAISASTIDIGGADTTSFHVDIDGNMWLGAALFADAPFSVTNEGVLIANSATIIGAIYSSIGNIGGWVISTNDLMDLAGAVGMSSLNTLDDDIRFWAGHTTPASAPFYVTKAGVLVASSATIAGDITATTGHFLAVTLGETGVASGTLTLQLLNGGGDTYINYGKTDFTNVDAGFILGIDDSDGDKAKLYLGNSLQWLSWNGTTLEYTNGLIVEPTIRLYVSGTLKTSDHAVDGSVDSSGIKITKDGFYAAGVSQNEANANIRILSTGDAYFKGTITADAGYIGGVDGWVITSKKLTGAADSKIVSGIFESSNWSADAGAQINLFESTLKFGGSASPKFMIDADGSMTAVEGIFKSAASGARVQIDANGIAIYVEGEVGKYNEFAWGDGTIWGCGTRIQIGSPSRGVPIYYPTFNNYADIHLAERAVTPTGAAEVNDICAVLGVLYICTVAGTPGTWTAIGSGGDEGETWEIAASAATMVAGIGYLVDTSAATFTLYCPATPATGDMIQFKDAAGTFNTKNLTLGRNGLKIMGLEEDMTISTRYASGKLVYAGATNGWRI